MNDPTLAAHLLASLQTIGSFLAYFGTALAITVVFVAIYVNVTPYREFALIRAGNAAAATSFTGALVGFVLPLASAIINSTSLIDMAIWGVIALIVQMIALIFARVTVPVVFRSIEAGQIASGVFLGGLSLAFGVLNAACMTW